MQKRASTMLSPSMSPATLGLILNGYELHISIFAIVIIGILGGSIKESSFAASCITIEEDLRSSFTYFYTSWTASYITLTDINSLAYMIYLAYPITLLLLGLVLWVVLIGIIAITST